MQIEEKHPIKIEGENKICIDIEIQQYLNGADLIRRAVDWFNENLQEHKVPYFFEEDSALNQYQLHMAKKTGKPNDDFPDIEKAQIVSKIKYFRFALCVNKQAIKPVQPVQGLSQQ